MKALLLTMGLVLSSNALAQQGYLCKHGEVIRTVEIVYTTPGEQVPCKVLYRRSTGTQTLWSAKSQIGYCESKAEAFIEMKRTKGFTCTEQADLQYDKIRDIRSSGFGKSVQKIKTEEQVIPKQEIKPEQLAKTKKVIYSKELFILK